MFTAKAEGNRERRDTKMLQAEVIEPSSLGLFGVPA